MKITWFTTFSVKRSPFLTFLFLIFTSLILFSGRAEGDEFKLIPSLSLKEEFNDNLFYTEKGKERDFITHISPGLELINRTEKLDISLLGRLDGYIYAKNNDLNNVDQNYRGKLRYLHHPKWKLSAEAGFTRDFRPDRDLEVSGLVTKAVRRDRQNYIGGTEYTFSEKTIASLSYSYDRYDYKIDDPEFSDLEAHGITFSLTHDLNRYLSRTMGRMNFGYNRYLFQESQGMETNIDYYYGTIGMSRDLSEKWSFLLDGGASYARSEFEVERLEFIPPFFFGVVRDKVTEKGLGWVGQATLSFRGEKTIKGPKTTGDLTFNHRVMPAVGRTGAVTRTGLNINLRHYFTYELSGGFSASYFLNKSDRGEFATGASNEETLLINPRIRYEFTKDIALEASYSFAFVKDKEGDTEAKRNLFMINFIIQYPLFE